MSCLSIAHRTATRTSSYARESRSTQCASSGTEQAHTRPLGQVDEVAGVAVVHGVGLGVGLGVGEEALPAELPQRFQEPVAGVVAGPGRRPPSTCRRAQRAGRACRPGVAARRRRSCAAARSKPPANTDSRANSALLASGSSRYDHSIAATRLWWRGSALRGRRQQPRTDHRAARPPRRRHGPHPGRGQLDRQREAVEPPADLGDGGRLAVGNEAGRAARPVDEQRHGVRRPAADGTGRTCSPAHAEGLTAGGQHGDAGHAAMQRADAARPPRRAHARSCPAPAAVACRRYSTTSARS